MTTRPTPSSETTRLEFPRARLILHLRPEALRQVQAQTTAGLQAVPRRGAEIGGLLLGTAAGEGGEFALDGVREVACEHRYGPSFLLTEQDRLGFASVEGEADGSGVIGIYRSQTRDGELLQPEDIELASSVEGSRLILIVQPQDLWRSVCHVFLRGSSDRWTHAGAFGLPDLAVTAAAPAVRPAPLAPRRVPRRAARWSIAFLVLLLAGAGGWWLWRQGRSRSNEAAATTAGEARPAVDSLGLRIERAGGDLKITWNGASKPVVNAVRGKLRIRDGPAERDLDLDADQLRSGNMLYLGSGRGDVLFRLEVVDDEGRAASESVRMISGVTMAMAAPLRVAAADRTIVPPVSAPPGQPAAPAPAVATRTLELPDRTRAAPAELPAPSLTSAPLTLTPPPASGGIPLPLQSPGPAAMAATAGFEQAKAVRQVRPVVPANIRSMLTREVLVTIRTVVDETGRVTHAVPAGESGAVVGRMLGALAAEAARGWRFEPARRNGVAVTSNVELVFRFNR